jgi:hypothetical protein
MENNFLQKKERRRRYKKLDPLKHMSSIDYRFDQTDDLSGVFPFKDVEDSAAYIRELRKNTWRR